MKKILICDDESDIRDVLEMILEVEFDIEVTHAVNGQDGISKLEESEFDLIICDMNMPKANGADVYNYNKSKNNYPFLLLSADSDADIYKFEGFTEVNSKNNIASKPWRDDELYSKIRPMLYG